MKEYPLIIQGGMGVGISGWVLARNVSMLGGLGTVSGVMFERVVARILQDGDSDGSIRRAFATFPFQKHAKIVLDEYFVDGGVINGKYKRIPMFTVDPSPLLQSLTICSVYAICWLAKEGHENPVSINFLEKVSMPHVYAITGAMLANVDFITMGAGLPFNIPQLINSVYEWGIASYPIPIVGKDSKNWNHTTSLDLKSFLGERPTQMKKPGFIPIVSSNFLAELLIKKIGKENIYGIVVELEKAGGHNAVNKREVDFLRLKDLGIPFWIGGATASPEMLKLAILVGAEGIQIGSIFALTEESGMDPIIRNKIRRLGFMNKLEVRTDPRISPTGFLFKVAVLPGSISEDDIREKRIRRCDKGGLVTLYEKEDGSIGYRCPAESKKNFITKCGDEKDIFGRGCLCNGLFSTCGMNYKLKEPPVVTLGDDFSFLHKLMKEEGDSYTVKDVFDFLTIN